MVGRDKTNKIKSGPINVGRSVGNGTNLESTVKIKITRVNWILPTRNGKTFKFDLHYFTIYQLKIL